MMNRTIAVTDGYLTHFAAPPSVKVHAPGRVNLIGEHTDYNDGFVFPAAINFGTDIAAGKRDDGQIHAIALDYDASLNVFNLDDIHHSSEQSWSNYIRGVMQVLREAFPVIGGANLVISGDVPQGAGLSSSASFEIALLRAMAELYDLPLDGKLAARLGQRAENEFVGCACGIMDQLISALGKQGQAMLLDCRSLNEQYTDLPAGFNLMIINSNVKRGLVDSAYNERRQQCELAASLLGVTKLRDASLDKLVAHKNEMPMKVYQRARHVISENQRTLDMYAALCRGDIATVSQLMRGSHLSMKEDFEITVEPIDYLVDLIHAELGEHGGVRMTGGGFGGCVVALVPDAMISQIQQVVEQNYKAHTGIKESIFICTAEQGAFS